jgi:hypothetical protein
VVAPRAATGAPRAKAHHASAQSERNWLGCQPTRRQRRLAPLGVNADGEVLEAGRVSDC